MQLKKVKVTTLRPNPYRNMKEYPLRAEKLEALRSSFEDTGF